MILLSPEVYRPWIQQAAYSLAHEKQGEAYSLFLHKVRVCATNYSYGGNVAAISMSRDGQFSLFLHWPTVSKMDLHVSKELLKHEILHAVYGHIGTRGNLLNKAYGKMVTNIAMDLVLNQLIDTKAFEKYDLHLVTIEKFGLKPNLTTPQYCELLKDKVIEVEISLSYEGDGKPEECNQPLKTKGSLEAVISEKGTDDKIVDTNLSNMLEQIREEMKNRHKEASCGRGWDSDEAKEYIAQVKRKPQVAWGAMLRRLESMCRSEDREVTKMRPSRRHPAHFGRKRKSSLRVWFGTDTSGSMRHQELSVVEPELRGVVQRGAELWLLQVDAEVKRLERFYPHSQLKEFYGRGGTDFSPFLEAIRKSQPYERPAFAVYYTDGEGGIERYVEAVSKEVDFAAFLAKRPTCTPEGVEILWLLAEGRTTPENFRKVVPFGHIAVLPRSELVLETEEDED